MILHNFRMLTPLQIIKPPAIPDTVRTQSLCAQWQLQLAVTLQYCSGEYCRL